VVVRRRVVDGKAKTARLVASKQAPTERHLFSGRNLCKTKVVQRRKQKIRGWVWGLLAATATLAVFLPALRFPFFPFWDDDIHVHANPHITELSWNSIRALWSAPWQQLYIPLTYSIWAGLAVVSRWAAGLPITSGALDAAWFHGANVVGHAISTALTFFLLRRVTEKFCNDTPEHRLNLAAALGALFFALHPLQVEPVAWISGLRDVLGGCLGLASLVVLFGGERPGPARWTFSTLLFVASLASKPAGVALPLVAGILAIVPFRWSWQQVVFSLGPWLVIGALWVVLTSNAQWAAELAVGLVPVWVRPLVAGDALAFYLAKTLWPSGLAADYGRSPDVALAAGWLWWAWLGPVALAVLLTAVKPLRVYLVPLLVFAAALMPTLGWVPFNFQLVSTVADRYAYLALIGPALALSMFVARTPKLRVTTLAAFVVAALLVVTVQRLPLWSEDVKLFAATLEVNPHSWKAMHNYASALDDRGRTEEAAVLMREVIVRRPDSAEAYNDLAVMVWNLGQRAEAAAFMRRSVVLRATPASARNLVVMEEELGNPAGRDEALLILRQLQTEGGN